MRWAELWKAEWATSFCSSQITAICAEFFGQCLPLRRLAERTFWLMKIILIEYSSGYD